MRPFRRQGTMMPTTPCDLFRAVRYDDDRFGGPLVVSGKPTAEVLWPQWYDNDKRNADVEITMREDEKEPHVDELRGTSLFNRRGCFGHTYWQYFKIVKDTPIPDGIIVRFTDYNGRYRADHYQIEPKTRMTVEAYKGALDNFARAAVARSYELAHH